MAQQKHNKQAIQSHSSDEPPENFLAFNAFSLLLTVALLFELLPAYSTELPFPLSIVWSAMLVAALGVFLHPSSSFFLALVAGMAAITLYLELPLVNNHDFLIMPTCGLIVSAYTILLWRQRGKSVSPSELYVMIAPPLRLMVLVLYFWAAFHKLNSGYFDPGISCGTMQLFNLQTRTVLGQELHFIPTHDLARYGAIYGTLIIEIAIPILLVLKRTRSSGVGLAMAFHFVLGIGYPAFSAFMYAMLSLFLSASFWNRATDWWLRSWLFRAMKRITSWHIIRSWLLVLGICVAAYVLLYRAEHLPSSRLQVRHTWWCLYGLLLIALFVRLQYYGRSTVPEESIAFFRLPHPALLIFPLLVFLNGLSPHIGLKNTQSFAMFSNLRTEEGQSNHYLIPASWQKFEYLNDLVTIKTSSDPVLLNLSRRKWPNRMRSPVFSIEITGTQELHKLYPRAPSWRLPYVSLKQHITHLAELGTKNIAVTYERNGVVREVMNAERDPELTTLSYWERKLLMLRAVPSIEEGCCMW